MDRWYGLGILCPRMRTSAGKSAPVFTWDWPEYPGGQRISADFTMGGTRASSSGSFWCDGLSLGHFVR